MKWPLAPTDVGTTHATITGGTRSHCKLVTRERLSVMVLRKGTEGPRPPVTWPGLPNEIFVD